MGVSGDVPKVMSPDITWQFRSINGNTVTDVVGDSNHVFSEDRRSLTFNNLTFSDEGMYIVTASNIVGNDTVSIELDVESELIYIQYSGLKCLHTED